MLSFKAKTSPETKLLDLPVKHLEELPLEDLLISSKDPLSLILTVLVIEILTREISQAMHNLEIIAEVTETSTQIVLLVNAAELMQMHFEFALGVLNSTTANQVQALKEKYSLIQPGYEKVKSKEDFSPIPTKHVIAIFHDKIFLEFHRVLAKSLQKDRQGNPQINENTHNLARLTIVTNWFELSQAQFPLVITFPKDDIFSFPRDSALWEDLRKSATFKVIKNLSFSHNVQKKVLTKEEVNSSSWSMRIVLRIGTIFCHKQIHDPCRSGLQVAWDLLKDIAYYGSQESRAETQAFFYLLKPKLEDAFQVWNLAEYPLMTKALLCRGPSPGHDERIYIPRLFPMITRDLILKEYEEKTFNKICPMDLNLFEVADLQDDKSEAIEELFIEASEKVPVRILAPEALKFKPENKKQGVIGKVFTGKKGPVKKVWPAIVIHIHGGGFVSMSSGTHRVYLNRWVKNLDLIHFSIDYRLSPKNQYPDALDDVWQAYLWILNYATPLLGIKYEKVILAGDSAGGNLALALILRLIRAGLQPPDGCLLMYPSLYVDGDSFSPSYFVSIDDPILPTSLLRLVAQAYVPEGFKNKEDPFISPMLASDELLEKIPPIRIVAGDVDPLHDDTWRLLSKLRRLGKDAHLTVHQNIPHAFLCHEDLKHYTRFIKEACDLISELIKIANTNSGNANVNASGS